MSTTITVSAISSMATKTVLTELAALFEQQHSVHVQIESVGGVQASQRVLAGERFDLVLLGSDAIDKLAAAKAIAADARKDWVRSHVAIAVPHGVTPPAVQTTAQLQAAVLACDRLSYSTGPSGVYLEKLFDQWGIADQIRPKIMVPPPGVPVGKLLAEKQVRLGFQQMSELVGVQGIDILGTLPPDIAYVTTFSGAVMPREDQNDATTRAAHAFLAFIASEAVESVKRKQGMFWL